MAASFLRRSIRSFLRPSTCTYSSSRSAGSAIGGVGVSPGGDFRGGERSFSSSASYNVAGGSSYMRGAVFSEPNAPLTIEDLHMPRPKANEVLIKTKGMLLILFLNLGFCGVFLVENTR